MRKATFCTVVLMTAFMITATDARASDNVYRWVDENGDVHFGDNPPEKAGAEVVDIQPSSKVSPQQAEQPASVADAGQPSHAQQQRDERAATRKEDEERKAALAAGCAQRYELQSQLEPSPRVMVKNVETGAVTRMDDNERLKVLGEAKAYIAENCKK